MIVVDASVMANAFVDDGLVGDAARAGLGLDPHWAGPEHVLVEVFSVVRGRWLGQKISTERAADAMTAVAAAAVELVSVRPLIGRMWELRNNVSGDDAAYVALAEAFGSPLVTADARLARVPELRCEIRLALPAQESPA